MKMRRKKWLMKKWPLYVCIGILGMLCIGVSFFLYAQTAARAPLAAGQQEKIIYPAQYSDTYITQNAIATDPKFKNLATFNKESFLANAVSSLRATPPAQVAEQPEKGTWLWTPTLDLTPAYWNPLIVNAKKNGIRNIYLSLDSYLDIYVMPDGADKEVKQKAFDTILENFITTAHKNNMTVDAEAGWRNWAEPGNEYKASAIVDYVLQFNAAHAEKFRGFQYDIEPYLLDAYVKEKAVVLRHFIDLINETVARLNNSDLAFSVVIPDFYDGASGETPRYFYGWRYSYTFTHLLNALERRPGSTLLVMAYRNKSEGTDGSINISQNEIQTANKYHTKIIIAQETGEVEPASFTFYNTSLSYLNSQIKNIQSAFAGDASYNGIAIHYINALMELE